MIDPESFSALRDAVQRDLLPELLRAIAVGYAPHVVGVHRAAGGVAVMLDLGDGVHVERQVVLDPLAVDLRLRLEVVGQAIGSLVDAATRRLVPVGPVPLTVGSRS